MFILSLQLTIKSTEPVPTSPFQPFEQPPLPACPVPDQFSTAAVLVTFCLQL